MQPPITVGKKLIIVFAVTNTVFASHTHPACCEGPRPLIMKIVGEEKRGNEMTEEVKASKTVKEGKEAGVTTWSSFSCFSLSS